MSEIEKKPLLVFTSTFPRWTGDKVPADFVYRLARELSKYYPTWVLAPHDPKASEDEEMEGLRVLRFPYFWPKCLQKLADGQGMLANIRRTFLAKVQVPFFLGSEILAFKRAARKHGIRLVNSHWLIPQGLVASLFKKKFGFVHAVTVHAADVFLLERLPFGKLLARYIVENSDIVIPVSRLNLEVLRKLAGRDFKAMVLPMGVEIEFFRSVLVPKTKADLRIDPDKKTILFVGKLTEKKGVVYLIRAMKEFSRRRQDVQLAIVGDGHLRQECEAEAHRLGLNGTVKFVGQKSKSEVKDFLSVSDVLIVPSIVDRHGETEGVPVAILEAMAAGLPVIASGVGGIPQVVIHGENGYITKEKDVAGLTQALQDIFSEDRLKRMGAKSSEIIGTLDWKAVGESYREAFESLEQGQ
ncbi:glycosyltransferase [Candidatus Uhrbacteria bacterium]|nr:glycosyltransferase [Candidatus Uhrbacteria bacterium]